MKLIQTYGNNCSVEIKHKPELVEKFFPLGSINKYITLQTKSGMPAKDYSYFQEVVNLLFPVLEKEGIKILHLGQDSAPLANVINLNNQTSIGQAVFIVKRGLLHVGVDSWLSHFAGANDIPLVSLYGNTTVANHAPYFYNKDKTIFLESHRNGNKATFAREENPKSVDLILPEDIVFSVLKLINIDYKNEFKTLWIGPNYQNRTVESANDCLIDISKLGLQNIIMRADINPDLNILFQQTQMNKVSIITDKPLPIDPLVQLKPNILEIAYKITKDHDPNFVKVLGQIKIPYKLFSDLKDEELNPIKLDYMDANSIIFRRDTSIPDILKDRDLSKLFVKSSKFLLGRGKIYQSYWDYKSDRYVNDFNGTILPVLDINIEELFVDRDNLYFLENLT